MDTEALRQLLRDVLQDEGVLSSPALANRWIDGTMVLRPADPGIAAKEFPIAALFRKVVMIRDRLRVLEQKLNGNPQLGDAEKLDMQQYITRAYGSLTTFNVLFRDRDDHFVGSSRDDA